MSAPPISVVDSAVLPEVLALEACQREFATLEAAHASVFRKLRELAGRYNACLAAADVAARSRKVSCGPIQIKAFVPQRDYQGLHDAIGVTAFKKAGGKIERSPSYAMNPKTFDGLLASGDVPQKVAEALVVWAPRYDKPSAIVLP